MSNLLVFSKRAALALALLATALPGPARADNKSVPAFDAFVKAFADVKDYKEEIIVHETSDDGKSVQDRTYDYRWRRNPLAAYIGITAGPGRGGGAAWHGGDKVSGHQGGFLSGIHLTIDIHDGRATSLRGDTVEVASFDYEIKHLLTTPGTMSERTGPAIDGQATTEVSLAVSDPSKNGNVTKDVVFLSNARHLPVRREQYVGAAVVKLENFKDVQTNTGLGDGDFR
jgi:outer membrane lipoprotein-sorting protein